MSTNIAATAEHPPTPKHRPGPSILVILGASGDLTARLLLPALYNLAAEGRLPEKFAILGSSIKDGTSADFREWMATAIGSFKTVDSIDPAVWQSLVSRMHYLPGSLDDPKFFHALAAKIDALSTDYGTEGNVLFYLALAPALFALAASQLAAAGLAQRPSGWSRLIVEKPFGKDLASAIDLNAKLRRDWAEEQIYRIDHYLGKETVQNIVAFRFANALYESVWNRQHIDYIQITASESVGVERRGGYYDKSGALRDMIQNHLLQVVSYVTMEPPTSCKAEDIRDAKTQLLKSIRVYGPAEIGTHCVRGQYGPGKVGPGYRGEDSVPPDSNTETFVAIKFLIDNDRWRGVPVYVRTGKKLWKRGTEIVLQFKRSSAEVFQGTPAEDQVDANRLIFHIQPDQGIEFRFQAKTPGVSLGLQKVNMRFNYVDAFGAGRGTGYEILLFSALSGDSTLFSRADLVETAWTIVQPILNAWSSTPGDFPNYPAGSWGPKAAGNMLEKDGFYWIEIINREVLEKVPLFAGINAATKSVFLGKAAMLLEPLQAAAGDPIVRKGERGEAMYFIIRGRVRVDDGAGRVLTEIDEGGYFGELSLLTTQPRAANVTAITSCDLLMLHKRDFDKLLGEHPEMAAELRAAAKMYEKA